MPDDAKAVIYVNGVRIGTADTLTMNHSYDYDEFSADQMGGPVLQSVRAPRPTHVRSVNYDHRSAMVSIQFAGGSIDGEATLKCEEIERTTGERAHFALQSTLGQQVTVQAELPGHVPPPAAREFDRFVRQPPDHPNCGPLLDEDRLRKWAEPAEAARPLERLDREVEAVAALAR
jgi:hypothetical protein